MQSLTEQAFDLWLKLKIILEEEPNLEARVHALGAALASLGFRGVKEGNSNLERDVLIAVANVVLAMYEDERALLALRHLHQVLKEVLDSEKNT